MSTSNHPRLWLFTVIAAFLLTIVIHLKYITDGGIAFWYDPARDMLLGLANLQKVTLIGPPSGIPNVFYGPYWIWLISIALLINKDPRFVTFFVVGIPYFTIFPYILYKMSKILTKSVAVIIWLLVTLSFSYDTQLWNPHLAPLIYLGFIYSFLTIDFEKNNVKNSLKIFATGIAAGLLMNFHLSFGIGIVVSGILSFFLELKINRKEYKDKLSTLFLQRLGMIIIFLGGISVAFIPFFLFEIRHGFFQSKAFLFTFTNALFYNSAVVGQTGLSKLEIFEGFFGRVGRIFQISFPLVCILYFTISASVIYHYKKGLLRFNSSEKKLLMILLFNLFTVLYIYISSKNPVWDYHFISVEILLLLLLGLLSKKIALIKYLLIIFTFWVVLISIVSFIKTLNRSIDFASYITKKHIVEAIYADANGAHFNRFAYDPSIYTYDYDYLFAWVGEEHNFIPAVNAINDSSSAVYLIIPTVKPSVKIDFVNYRTPEKAYKTAKEWFAADGTTILKRVKK